MADESTKVECPICGNLWKKNNINQHVNRCLNNLETSPNPKEGKRSAVSDDECTDQPQKRQKVADTGPKGEAASLQNKAAAWGCLASPKSTKTNAVKGKPNIDHKESFSRSAKNLQTDVSNLVSVGGSVDQPLIIPDSRTNPDPRTLSKTGTSDSRMNQSDKVPVLLKSQSKASSTSNVQVTKNSFSFFSQTKPQTASKASTLAQSNLSAQKSQSLPPAAAMKSNVPLAEKMRPKILKDYVGQDKIIGKNKLFRSLVESHHIPSMILWGPPGCGKTTLARIIAQRCKESHDTRFTMLSATTAGVADVKEAVKIAKNEIKMFKRKTILFIDEIHRFNKLQQDSLLPHVEDGTIILIGATTENPSFQVNNALLSRCKCINLESLSQADVEKILMRAVGEIGVKCVENAEAISQDTETDGAMSVIYIEEGAVSTLAGLCGGDARVALNGLQTAVDSKQAAKSLEKTEDQVCIISVKDVKEALEKSHILYDRAGEEHFNCASALQKSIRGSDDNAAIYWLARMLEGGEDPLFIARRLVVTASEDIGMADPQAMILAVSTFQACQFIGRPECRLNLAQCVTYLARAPKSVESYFALEAATNSIRENQGPLPPVPLHLRNASTKLMKDMGYGKGYEHNPDFKQEYLPKSLQSVNFFKSKFPK